MSGDVLETSLSGKVAVVTGGETGIGRAICEELARHGAKILIGGVLNDEGKNLAQNLAARGAEVQFLATDVQSVEQVEALYAAAVASHGRVDIAINSAGVFDGFATCLETTDGLWDRVVDINLKGSFLSCRAALKYMVPVGKGRIVNISSVGGLRGGADGCSYTASKYGLIGLTQQIAVTYADRGISVNAVCPGVIDTGIRANSAKILADDAPGMAGVGTNPDAFKLLVPAQRKGGAAEVAALVAFLASDAAGYINGQAIAIDGGWTAR